MLGSGDEGIGDFVFIRELASVPANVYTDALEIKARGIDDTLNIVCISPLREMVPEKSAGMIRPFHRALVL